MVRASDFIKRLAHVIISISSIGGERSCIQHCLTRSHRVATPEPSIPRAAVLYCSPRVAKLVVAHNIMSNRSTLINKSTPDYAASDIDSGFLAAKYSIAVFWPSLFDQQDLRCLNHVNDTSGEAFRIPYLTTPLSAALARWYARKRSFSSLSNIALKAVESFDSSLALLTKPHLILDTWEIWTMYEKDFDLFLLGFIEQSQRGDLSALIEQANIRDGQEDIGHYTGFAWNTGTQ